MTAVVAVGMLGGCPPPATRIALPSRWDRGALHAFGAPPIDPAIESALDRYAAIVPSRLLDLAPDGGAVLVARGGDAMIVRAPLAEPIARSDGVDVEWAAFTTADAIAFTADREGDEVTRLYRGDAIVDRRVVDPVHDRARIAWAEPATDGATTALWLDDRNVFTGDGSWSPIELSGDQLLARRSVSARSSAQYRIDLRTGAAAAVTPVAPEIASPSGAFGPRGELYAISNFGGDRLGVWELTSPPRPIAPALAWDVDELAVSPDGAMLAFTTDEDGVSVLRLYDVATRTVRIAPNAPTGGVIGELRFAAGAPVIGLSFSDPRRPRDVLTYDVRDAHLVAWTRAELGATAPPIEPDRVAVASEGGTAIAMLAYRPQTVRGVVVELHGGPEDQWLPRWSPFEQFLASRGFAVLQPNVRGSLGYGARFAALDDGAHREAAVRDVGAVLDWIAHQPELAHRPTAVMGTSYGGYLALASLIAYGDRLRAGVELAGIADFVSFLSGTSGYRRDQRRAEYGDERVPAARAFLMQISPLAHAAAIHVPLVVAQGRRDPRVPAGDAERLVRAVRGPVWFLVADDEGHGFSKTANVVAFEALVTQLLDQMR